jgi:transposase InsO family protein
MAWKEVSIVVLRREFVMLGQHRGANIRQLCRRFGISPTTGYKWLRRYRRNGQETFCDRSRRPHYSPRRSRRETEQQLLTVRDAHPAWGARKIRSRLQSLGQARLPAASTIHAILHRHGRIDPEQGSKHQKWQRFEQEAPNQLWQMDFKGHFLLGNGARCHPLTVLDDHSRYALCLQGCHDEQGRTVQQQLTQTFRRYGLPQRILVDNGAPWGNDLEHPFTPLTVWLLRLGIGVCHSRPYHPQTQGKEERFHRTLKAEVLAGVTFPDLLALQQRLDQWRSIYNHQRPHQALAMAVPSSRYQVSERCFPATLPPLEYGSGDVVRKVQNHGRISFHHQAFRISKAFRGYSVALRSTTEDGLWEVYFATHCIARIDLRETPSEPTFKTGAPLRTKRSGRLQS